MAAVFSVGTSLAGLAAPGAAAASVPSVGKMVRLGGQVPAGVSPTGFIGRHNPASTLTIDIGLPLRNMAALNRLIVQEATTHTYLSRAQLYAEFAPSRSQYLAVRSWLQGQGFSPSYTTSDNLIMGFHATTAQVNALFHVQIDDFRAPSGRVFY